MNNGTFREMGTRPWSFKVLYFMATSLPFVTNASVWTGQMVSLPTNTVVMGNFVCCQTWPRGPDSTLCLDVSVKVLLADDVIGNGGPGQAEALSRVFSRAVQRQHGGSSSSCLCYWSWVTTSWSQPGTKGWSPKALRFILGWHQCPLPQWQTGGHRTS